MNLLDRLRRWCAAPYVALAQVKFDLDVATLHLQLAQARMENYTVYRQGYVQGAKDMEVYCADTQEQAEARVVH